MIINRRKLRTRRGKELNATNLGEGNTIDTDFINNVVNLFIEWVLNNKLTGKKGRNKDKDIAKLALARPFLVDFFEVFHREIGLSQYVNTKVVDSPEGDAKLTINWLTFPFEVFYNTVMKHLFSIQNTRSDYKINKHMFVVHHIFPKNEGGGEESSNKVLLHICEHGSVHLIRWLYTGSSRDLGAFTSNIRTEESISLQKERRAANPPRLVIPPPPPADRPKPQVTARVIQHSSTLGKNHQINSRLRVNPFTWFIASQPILMEHTTKITYTHKPAADILDSVNTASAIARQLATLTSDESLAKTPQVLSQVLGNEKKSRAGWSVVHVTIGEKTYSLSTLQFIFTQAMDTFLGKDLSISLTEEKYVSLPDGSRIMAIDYSQILNHMLQFLAQRQHFINRYNQNKTASP